jgi:sortase (surface protein transpeptidase)
MVRFHLLYPRFALTTFLWVSLLLSLTACQINLIPPSAASTAVDSEEIAAVVPVSLAIPALELELPIKPMGWEIVDNGGELTTRWVLPEDAVGWHINSAAVGEEGRVILSGHQLAGEAPLAPLAQGAIEVGQTLLLTDSTGETFTYEIVEVTEPLPLLDATPEEEELTASYVEPSTTGTLTLISGWPDFSNTHRIFALAELVTD